MEMVEIRAAIKEDMKYVYQMIKELAEFEQLGDQVKITPKVLEEDGFGTNPGFHSFVAEHKLNGIIGYALYYNCYSTWRGKSIFLEDLYVQPEYRKLGIGKQLFLHVAKVAQGLCGRLDFHVLSWNQAAEFYIKMGAQNLSELEEWRLFRMDEHCLNKLLT